MGDHLRDDPSSTTVNRAEEGPLTWAFVNRRWRSRGICPVHTEEVTGSIPVSPTRSEHMLTCAELIAGAISVAKCAAIRSDPVCDPVRCAAWRAGVAGARTPSTSITRGSAATPVAIGTARDDGHRGDQPLGRPQLNPGDPDRLPPRASTGGDFWGRDDGPDLCRWCKVIFRGECMCTLAPRSD